MKKVIASMLGLTLLGGCAFYQSDFSEERAELQALRRSVYGCPDTYGANAELRSCMYQTYTRSHPKTYVTGELQDGQPIAIFRPMQEIQTATVTETAVTEEPTAEVITLETIETTAPEEFVTETTTVETTIKPKEKTWWETYREKRMKDKPVVCPCTDPNDPCPQCVEK